MRRLTQEEKEKIKNRIEELHGDSIESEQEYREYYQYYKNELLNGYLD